jgi:outer membrane protein
MPIRRYLFAVLLALAGATAWGQSVKIGVVNLQRIERDSARSEQATQQLRKDFESRGKELAAVQQRLREARERYEKAAVGMPASQRQKEERELVQQAQRLEQQERAFNEDLELRKAQLRGDLREELGSIIKTIAEADKLDLVITDAVMASKAVDITDRVLQELAKRAKSGAPIRK